MNHLSFGFLFTLLFNISASFGQITVSDLFLNINIDTSFFAIKKSLNKNQNFVIKNGKQNLYKLVNQEADSIVNLDTTFFSNPTSFLPDSTEIELTGYSMNVIDDKPEYYEIECTLSRYFSDLQYAQFFYNKILEIITKKGQSKLFFTYSGGNSSGCIDCQPDILLGSGIGFNLNDDKYLRIIIEKYTGSIYNLEIICRWRTNQLN